jgi:hypothetical protein
VVIVEEPAVVAGLAESGLDCIEIHEGNSTTDKCTAVREP